MISRIKSGKKFSFVKNNKVIKQKSILNKIYKLRIPPAWKDVQITLDDDVKVHAVGKDIKNKTQYIYNDKWTKYSTNEKFKRFFLFAKKVNILTSKINKILESKEFDNEEFIVALIIKILFLTHCRVGNETYANENNTYGLTTLLKKHVSFDGSTIKFDFIGKKHVQQNIRFSDSLCLKYLKELLTFPGERLFKTKSGILIGSSHVNDFIRKNIGDFTAKDIRTYTSNQLFIEILKSKDIPINTTDAKRKLNSSLEEVSNKLGNSKAICKKSYILPDIVNHYMESPSHVKKFNISFFEKK